MEKLKIGALTLAMSLLLVSCSGGEEASSDVTDPTSETSNEASTSTSADNSESQESSSESSAQASTDDQNQDSSNTTTASGLSMEEAIDLANQEAGVELNITSVDYDTDSGKFTYEIEAWADTNEYSYEIDAETGDVLEKDQEDLDSDDDDDQYAIEFSEIIRPEEAIEKAKEVASSDTVEGWTLDYEDNVLAYEVEFEDSDEDIYVDARTGEVRQDD